MTPSRPTPQSCPSSSTILPMCAFLQEGLLRVADAGKRIGRGHQRTDFTPLDIAHQISEELRSEHGTAEEAQILQVNGAQIESHGCTRNGAGNGITPGSNQTLQPSAHLRTTGNIYHHLQCIGSKHRHRINVTREYPRRAQCTQGRRLALPCHRGNLSATARGQLYRGRTHAPEAPVTSTRSPRPTPARCSMFSAAE